MTEQSRVEIFRALLATKDDGLDEKRRHTYIWDRSDGREKLKPRQTLIERFVLKRRTA